MARKPVPNSQKDNESKDAFVSAVRFAYEHVADAEWLGKNSPLATPYVLGTLLIGEPLADSPLGQGLVVQRLLGEAVDAQEESLRNVLTLYYYDPEIQNSPRKRAELVGEVLHCREAEVYRRLRAALGEAAAFIGKRLLPTVRPEMPLARTVFGRSNIVNDALQALLDGESVALSGPSGMGKTATGLAITEKFGHDRALWFTVRLGLNDTLANLVYAIAFFLRSFGALSVWRQIVADHKILEKETLISGLIRHEFANIQPPLLLCLDEVGCLDPDLGEHNRIIRFLEGLRDQIPMLLMGSQVLVDLGNRQHHHVLRGIEPEAADLLFASEKLHALSEADKATVLSLTRGNPALMRMFALLHHTGEPVEISLKRIADDPSAEAMLYRVFEHLSATEQRTLSALSVFREAAPRDAWEQSEDQGSLDSLIRYGLAHPDLTGGIEVAPFARTFVLKRMPRDVRADHSRRAGEAMAARGSHTSAAVYFAEAGDIPKSIRLWAAHWEAEVSRGNGAIALDLFGNIAREKEKLDVEDQRMLALLLADLLTANGHPGKSIERINDVSWPEDHPLSPYAFRLRGTAYRDRNQTQAALEQYTTALEILTKPPLVQRVYLHCRRGYVYELQLSDFAAARLDANLARLDAANFMGNVEEADGNFESARQHYTDALAICKSIQAVEACEIQAHHCHSNLSRLAWRQDRLAEAFEHIQLALAISKKAGWLTAELVDRINLSAAHLIASQPEQALAIAEDALRDAADIENNYIVSGLCSNAAEACFLLGRIDEAEHYADRVIRMKEPDRTPNALLVLGKVFRARKLHTNLVATLEQAIKAALDGGDQYTCGAAWCELGDVYFDTDDREHALKCWKESLSIFQQLGNDRQCRALGQRMQQC